MRTVTLSPAQKKVVKTLDQHGQMTHKELVRMTRLKPRTVRFVLKKLRERKMLIMKLNISDARQIIYQNRPAWAPDLTQSADEGNAGHILRHHEGYA